MNCVGSLLTLLHFVDYGFAKRPVVVPSLFTDDCLEIDLYRRLPLFISGETVDPRSNVGTASARWRMPRRCAVHPFLRDGLLPLL